MSTVGVGAGNFDRHLDMEPSLDVAARAIICPILNQMDVSIAGPMPSIGKLTVTRKMRSFEPFQPKKSMNAPQNRWQLISRWPFFTPKHYREGTV